MCGITGIFNLQNLPSPSMDELKPMITRLAHRGPDGYGYYADNQVGLAHARLSIIDLQGGDQPIHNENNSIQVVFNGEIFNYIELRKALEGQGHSFYTQSDTEVIVHLYEQYGDSFVNHLNGQFAIALWDKESRRLILARDRTGIRPLFYSVTGGRLFFASEVKALFAHPALKRRLDIRAMGEIFTYWAPLPSHSIFEGIATLPPGHIMCVEKGELDIRRYWDWQFPT
ncbi:MAG TPA: asparagine synthetase B, partial [Gammaproteobacteria bacterium]|nr:asparagine synthetase B [Gammaproteobacteria bacterium]